MASIIAPELAAAVDHLSVAERLALVEYIQDTLDVPDPAIDQAWAEEAARRFAEYKAGRMGTMTLEELKAKYRCG